jgi:hypothetical protein
MSTDPISARETDPAPYEAHEDPAGHEDREDEERLDPMTEYPETPERFPAGTRGSDAGFERVEHEHALGGQEEQQEDQEEAQEVEAAPSAASPDTIGTGRFGETGGIAAEESRYGTDGDDAMDGGRDDVVIAPDQNTDFRTRWREIQAEFIEDPQRAAKDADELVSEITKVFAAQAEERRNRLASSWQREGTHGTEELRLVMRHYRGLVDHMLDR